MEITSDPSTIFPHAKNIGVIWATDEARKLGYYNGNPDWANFGQGQPETGQFKNGNTRIETIDIEPQDNNYGPVNGMDLLRQTVATHYNRLYRPGKASQYTAENVSIAMGGRLALTRILAMMGEVRLGYKVPEYPAYENLINYQLHHITPVYVPTLQINNHSLPAEDFKNAVEKYKLDAFLFSNPCNPTGHVMKGKSLHNFLTVAREQECNLIVDEMYSHFIYENGGPASGPVSAAEFIDDVDRDPVLIVDGLTKSFRYPGWRLAWVLGPKQIISDMGRASSSIDGGPSQPVQRAAIPLFEPSAVNHETQVLRQVFSHKQNLMIHALKELGITCSPDASSTFYLWADISALPSPLNNALHFFKEALKLKVVTLPGYFFEIHPGEQSRLTEFSQHLRLSFGPEEENVKMGLDRLSQLIQSHR